MKVGGAALFLTTQAFLARLLGPEHYGIYIYVAAWLAVLVLLGKLGLDTMVLRYVAEYRAREEWGLLRSVLRSADRMALSASLMIGACAVLATWVLIDPADTALRTTLWIGCGVLPVMALSQIRRAALRAFRLVARAYSPDAIFRPCLFVVLLLTAALVSRRPLTAPAATGLYGIASLGSFLLLVSWLRGIVRRHVEIAAVDTQWRTWLAEASPLVFLSGFSLVNSRADVIMLGVLGGTTAAGIYAAAARLSELVGWGLFAVNAVAAPMFAHLHARGKTEELQQVVSRASLGIAAFTLPVAAIMVLGGPWLLGLFGEPFRQAYGALLVLLVGQVLSAMVGSVGYLATMTGHQRSAAAIMGASATLNVILNTLLIPRFGWLGAAWSTSISGVTWNGLMYFAIRRRLGIDSTLLSLLRTRARKDLAPPVRERVAEACELSSQ